MKIIIVGAGFGGLGAAGLLAKAGHDVTVFEKNGQLGGRAGSFTAKGFRFDTGPSWYLMPEVFERFFNLMDEKIENHFKLEQVSPSFRVTFKDRDQIDLAGNLKQDAKTFEGVEPGAGVQLAKYLARAEQIHGIATGKFLYNNYDSFKDLARPDLLARGIGWRIFESLHKQVSRYFKDERLRQILEYPAVFLGGSPYNVPALYSLMNHVILNQGVYYPRGGMHEVTKALARIARRHGVKFELNAPVEKIIAKGGRATGVRVGGKTYQADVVISNADRHHTDTNLLSQPAPKRTIAPSALLIYLGVSRKYDSLKHHNLLFSQDWAQNFHQIFDSPAWPDDPSLYVCAPSRTDPTVAPSGHENLFVLVPVAAGLNYATDQLDIFAGKILETIERELKLPGLRKHIVYKKLFCVKDFAEQYNSYQGSGLGLTHTLRQSAMFRPGNRHKHIDHLYYVGADTFPGIGLPSCLISAELVAKRLAENE